MLSEPGILIAREHDSAALARALRRGEVERLRTGAYRVVAADGVGPAYASDVTARLVAVHRQLRAPHAFSHLSAAVVWGLRRWSEPTRTHVVQAYRASSRAADDVVRHFAPVDHEVTERHGLPVTSLARTVVDCATTLHPLEALVVVDSALAAGLDRDEALELLRARGRVRGRRRARIVIGLGDAGAESAWETWLRYIALRAGLPEPVTQFPVVTRLGRFRVDLALAGGQVLAEFDGRVKYRDGAFGPGYDADAARFEEKRRADAIEEATGLQIVRVTSSDHPTDVATRLRRRCPDGLVTTPNRLLPPTPR